MNDNTPVAAPQNIAISYSSGFPEFLSEINGSIALSTYQAGRVIFIGLNEGGTVRGTELAFPRSMGIGLSSDAQKIYLATQHQIIRFDNFLRDGQKGDDGVDALYVPRLTWTTGDLDAHDIQPGPGGRPFFVNTAFNCISTVSAGYSFKPVWRPKFITEFAHDDRCHLNGMAMINDHPRYATLVAQTNESKGWRQQRAGGGGVIDITSNEVILDGLSMPHSPRWYQGKLWVLNSGEGTLGWIDSERRELNVVADCPGFARGLSFVGNYALVAISGPRDERLFEGLPLQEKLQKQGINAVCSVIAIDLRTGQTVAHMALGEPVRELYDVQYLPGVRAPHAIGFRTEEIRRLISIDG